MSVVEIVDHPLIQHKISLLRDRNTGTKEFRDLVSAVSYTHLTLPTKRIV